ncbi:uncharacterized protein LOC117337595 isoform X1 [Pecten maximus]|uniref:uncharacterized protein LOC117337595 isoform X1 n=1 Tax=Pecten maximus TaxID=6579 RepID=UPI001458980A|nr:uncharacterized protein LOC117337595 isoform X1 [Pecten maximus]
MHLISVIGALVTLWGACEGLRGIGRTVKLTHADRAMLINYHNELRREVHASNMQELSWDREAARAARKWGRMCKYDRPRNDRYGENIFYNKHNISEPTSEVTMDALGVWSKEKNTFDSQQSCVKTRSCDYLKMVTANVESVGCAITKCPVLRIGKSRRQHNVNLVACFYTPFIDVSRTEPYMYGAPCTYCRTGYSCRRGLCSPPVIPMPNMVIEFGDEYDKDRQSNVNHIIKESNPVSNKHDTPAMNTIENDVSQTIGDRLPGRSLGDQAELRRGRTVTRTYRRPTSGQSNVVHSNRFQELTSRVKRQATRSRSRYSRYDPYAAERRRRREEERRRQHEMRRKRLEEEQRRRQEEERRRRVQNQAYRRRDGQGQGPVEQRARAPMTEILTELGDGDVLDVVYENITEDVAKDSTEVLIEDVTEILAEDDNEEILTEDISNAIPPFDPYAEERRLRNLERELHAKILEIRKKHMELTAQRLQKEEEPKEKGELSDNDEYYLLQIHNNIRTSGIAKLEWSKRLEKWARYVIRCDIEYPGPAFCFTNFGKIGLDRPIYNIVYDWNAEGTALSNELETGCRTPYDRSLCNHHLVMNNRDIREMACASLDCGGQRQVTCIYQ